MPMKLEKKLKNGYGSDKHAIYGTMNRIEKEKKAKAMSKALEMRKK